MKFRQLIVMAAIPFLFSSCFKTRAELAKEREEAEVRTALQQNIVDTSQGVEKIEKEIAHLNGRIEELEHYRKKELAGLSSTREADRKQLEELRAKVETLQSGQSALFEEIKALKEERLQAEKALNEKSQFKTVPSRKGQGNLGTFDSAVAYFKSKDYPKAVEGFRAYIDNNPKGKHLIDAQYLLGEALYAEKDYAQAVVAYGVVHEKRPTSVIGRKSTLKIAQSFKAMGKDKDAKAFAQLLVQGSPASAEAKLAKKLLR